MRTISLRRLLARLTMLALAATPGAVEAAGASPSSIADPELGEDLPIDREFLDAEDASTVLGRGLALALSELCPLDATYLATSWAIAQDPLRRAAVANALEWAFPLVGAGVILDHLASDPDPVIRAACARAAWVRRGTGGDPGVLERLATDPDPGVRAIAERAR